MQADNLRTVSHLIASSENPTQAMLRVLDFVRAEFPSPRGAEEKERQDPVGIYFAQAGRLLPGPGIMPDDTCACESANLPLRDVALRAAYSGKTERIERAGKIELAVPILLSDAVVGVLVTQLARAPDAEKEDFLRAVAGRLSPLV